MQGFMFSSSVLEVCYRAILQLTIDNYVLVLNFYLLFVKKLLKCIKKNRNKKNSRLIMLHTPFGFIYLTQFYTNS